METKSFSGEELAKALQEGFLEQPLPDLVGIVKKSDKENHVAFSLQGCERWFDIPVSMIMNAEQMCGDHSHLL
jgi:hypothetical protein